MNPLLLALSTFLTFICFVSGDQTLGMCCLCSGCGPAVRGRENLYVNSNHQTCTDLILYMADPTNTCTPGSQECTNLKAKHYNTCCNPNYVPIPIMQVPTPSPRSKYPKGPYPSCNLCKNGQYPKCPNTVTAVLDVPGNPTCKDLYYMGLQGSISDQMCKPMEFYMEGPCGCLAESSC